MTGGPCRPHIVDAGFPFRTNVVLHREEVDYSHRIMRVLRLGRGSPEGIEDLLTLAVLEQGFADRDATTLPAASWLAGRVACPDGEDDDLDQELRDVVDGLTPASLLDWAPSYVEAAMSLALRGDIVRGHDALEVLVAEDAPRSLADWLAAYYLAQMGDPSGYPALIGMLNAGEGFTRLMAARHLVGFRPYDGQTIDGHVVDVRARLLDRMDDPDELVSIEVPPLLAEAGVDDVRGAISMAKHSRHDRTRTIAAQVLADLAEHGG